MSAATLEVTSAHTDTHARVKQKTMEQTIRIGESRAEWRRDDDGTGDRSSVPFINATILLSHAPSSTFVQTKRRVQYAKRRLLQ